MMEEEIKDVPTTEEEAAVKTYSEEEVQKLLQAETDRKTTKALQTAREKWEQEYKEKLAQEKSEAEKLASMSAEEKARLELNKQKEQFETERQQFLREKMELETVKQLSSQGLPVDFARYVLADDAETVSNNIKAFKEQWETAISNAVEERLKGRTPKMASTGNTEKVLTKDAFANMSYKDRARLLQADPNLLTKLN